MATNTPSPLTGSTPTDRAPHLAFLEISDHLSEAKKGLGAFGTLDQMDRMAQEHDPTAPHLGDIMEVILLMCDGISHRITQAERIADAALAGMEG